MNNWIMEAIILQHSEPRFLEGRLALIYDSSFVPFLFFYFPMYCLELHFVISLLYLGLKAQ